MDIHETRELTSRLLSMMYRMHLLNKKGHTLTEIPPAEFCMLLAIAKCTEEKGNIESPGITISQMIKEMGTTFPAGSKLLRSIEKKGLIERSGYEKDRRVTYLRLSPKGLIMLKEQVEARDKTMVNIVCKMGEENMEMLLTQMQNLYSILKEEMEEKKHD